MIDEESIKKFILITVILFVISSVTIGVISFLSATNEEEQPNSTKRENKNINENTVSVSIKLYNNHTEQLIENNATITIYESDKKETKIATLDSPKDKIKNIKKDTYYLVITSEYYTNINKQITVNKQIIYSINLQPNKLIIQTAEFKSGNIILISNSGETVINTSFNNEDKEIIIDDIKSGKYTLKLALDNANNIIKEIKINGKTIFKINK